MVINFGQWIDCVSFSLEQMPNANVDLTTVWYAVKTCIDLVANRIVHRRIGRWTFHRMSSLVVAVPSTPLMVKIPTKTIIPVAMRMTLCSAISEPGMPRHLMSPAIFYKGLKFLHKSITPRARGWETRTRFERLHWIVCIVPQKHGKSGKVIWTRRFIDNAWRFENIYRVWLESRFHEYSPYWLRVPLKSFKVDASPLRLSKSPLEYCP